MDIASTGNGREIIEAPKQVKFGESLQNTKIEGRTTYAATREAQSH